MPLAYLSLFSRPANPWLGRATRIRASLPAMKATPGLFRGRLCCPRNLPVPSRRHGCHPFPAWIRWFPAIVGRREAGGGRATRGNGVCLLILLPMQSRCYRKDINRASLARLFFIRTRSAKHEALPEVSGPETSNLVHAILWWGGGIRNCLPTLDNGRLGSSSGSFVSRGSHVSCVSAALLATRCRRTTNVSTHGAELGCSTPALST